MRILLVDDDTAVVQALLAILKTLPGHELRAAMSGEKALEQVAALGGVDLLITDVVMEPMNGFMLRDEIAARYPEARVILISGFDLSDYPEQTQGHQLLVKPIDADALRAAVAGPTSAPPEALPEPEPIPEPEVIPVPAVAAVVPQAVPMPAAPAVARVASPTAAPSAVPRAVPMAQPTARPSAVPQAVPVARPTAVPAAQPTIKATAVPQAVPAATPLAQPQPDGSPQPVRPKTVTVPQSNAVPSAANPPKAPPTVRVAGTVKLAPIPLPSAPRAELRPASAPAPASAPPAKPVVNPAAAVPSAAVRTVKAAVPTPAAAPRVVRPPSAVAVPSATPVAQPKMPSAVAAPRPAVATPVAPISVPAPTVEPGELAGQTLGAYELLRKIGNGQWGSVYAGVQVSINRPVALEILDADKADDEATRERFIADARAKAQVQHPSILAVYEAGESDGRFFYAHEFVDGGNLAEFKASGERLDEPAALKVLRVAADGLAYLTAHHIPHHPPDAASISIGSDGQPHLANLATQVADGQLTMVQEIQALGRIMLSQLPAIQTLSQGLRDLLKAMVQTGPDSLTAWPAVMQVIKAIEPKVVPVEAAKISAQDRAAIAAVEQARREQKRTLYISVGSMGTLLVLVGILVYWFIHSNERNLEEQVKIPGGEYLFANGEGKTLPDFWIDKYEVTYGQYAKFVHALEAHSTSDYDDVRQPRIKTAAMHKPPNWDIYYRNAVAGRAAHQTPIDLNCPVMEVDYWDAYAYAKWKGRELPTEEEWEKAARGTKGFTYPWGEDFDPKKVNSNADYDQNNPGAKGAIDGYNFWNPVDKIKGDKSPFGVMGMAGNVREWTGTWDPGKKRPVVKGGSFMSSDVRLDQRTEMDPSTISESLGFRTISHSPPPPKK